MTDKVTNYEQALEQLPRMLEDLANHPENFKRLARDVFNQFTVIDGGKNDSN